MVVKCWVILLLVGNPTFGEPGSPSGDAGSHAPEVIPDHPSFRPLPNEHTHHTAAPEDGFPQKEVSAGTNSHRFCKEKGGG